MDVSIDSEARLTQLEVRFSYQEKQLEDLNMRIFELQTVIDRLENTQRVMSSRLKEVSEAVGSPMASNVRPPHY
jgi:uncharacterized coiled-coil protein SlyX